MGLPGKVMITEVGPRDGLQMEKRVVPTPLKLELIAGLAEAGLPAIQVAAFVHPAKMPQMADAEALIERLPQSQIQYSALTLNLEGVERACRTSIPWIEISLSASEIHSRDNTGLALSEAAEQVAPMAALALRNGRRLRASISCAFGYAAHADVGLDRVVGLAELLLAQGIDQLLLADTAGLASPQTIEQRLAAVIPKAGRVPVGLHLHDTHGQGQANLRVALDMGIVHFDTALGGLGGCPFIPGARGNIATESTVNLMESLGIHTGIDVARIALWTERLNRFLGRPSHN